MNSSSFVLRTMPALFALVVSACSHAPIAEHANRAAGAGRTFEITATDSGFIAPDHLAAGLRHIVFRNRGSVLHESMLVKLPEGMDAKAYQDAVRAGSQFPEGALDYNGAGLTGPGESVEVWVRVDPGHYLLICWNAGHAKTVPAWPFTVTQDNVPDDVPPPADAVIRQIDYRFEVAGNLRSGVRTVRIETPGPSMHEVDIFRLRGNSTLDDLRHWRRREDSHLPPDTSQPADAMGGMGDSHDIHRVGWLRRNFAPGRYALLCGMPMEGAKGVVHGDVGMVSELVVAE